SLQNMREVVRIVAVFFDQMFRCADRHRDKARLLLRGLLLSHRAEAFSGRLRPWRVFLRSTVDLLADKDGRALLQDRVMRVRALGYQDEFLVVGQQDADVFQGIGNVRLPEAKAKRGGVMLD